MHLFVFVMLLRKKNIERPRTMDVLGGGDFERDFLELIKLRCHVRYRTWNFRATRFPKSVIKIDVGIWAFLNFALFGFYGDGN